MAEYYSLIKNLHVFCVLLSGSVFGLRGLAMLGRSSWANHKVVKRFSYLNDSVLLAAGLLLMHISGQHPGTQTWLGVKLCLLLVYIVLGVFALRRGRSYSQRRGYFFAAIAVYLFMFSVARAHHPLGLFHGL